MTLRGVGAWLWVSAHHVGEVPIRSRHQGLRRVRNGHRPRIRCKAMGTLELIRCRPPAITTNVEPITIHQNGEAGTRVVTSDTAAAARPTYDQVIQ